MKPYVICHMCTTIDGKILVDRWGKLPGGENGASLFETTADHFGIGAWIVGTTTMKEFAGRNFKLKPVKQSIERGDHVANPNAVRFAIGVDAKGVLRFRRGDVDGDHVVLLLTDQVSDDFLAHLQAAGASYLFCGRTQVNLSVALDKLRRTLGIKKLMLEGGGKFNGSMLHAGFVDEISQVIVPVADGGMCVSSIFEIPAEVSKKAAATLRVTSQKKLPGGVNWFRYHVVSRPSR
jgi:2,5-diamino-6-(ribosylamino)-4(3H)-pyrimidinone 5'-phosphate reductase